MRPCVPMHNALMLDRLPRWTLACGGPRLASSVFETRSFFTNPS